MSENSKIFLAIYEENSADTEVLSRLRAAGGIAPFWGWFSPRFDNPMPLLR